MDSKEPYSYSVPSPPIDGLIIPAQKRWAVWKGGGRVRKVTLHTAGGRWGASAVRKVTLHTRPPSIHTGLCSLYIIKKSTDPYKVHNIR
jgi:hypothetical protein